MNTEGLIRALAADRRPDEAPGRALAMALVLGFAAAGLVFALTLGLRPDFFRAIWTWRFDFKFALTLALSVAAVPLALRMASPVMENRRRALLLLVPAVLLMLALVVEAVSFPAHQWMPRLIGHNSRICMAMIPVLSLAPLAAMLWALRRGAPLNPVRTGAVAGLIAGGIGAAWYAAHCPDDSPLFVAVWYTIGLMIVTALGAALGSRLLRW